MPRTTPLSIEQSVTSWYTDSPRRPSCAVASHSPSSSASPTASLSTPAKIFSGSTSTWVSLSLYSFRSSPYNSGIRWIDCHSSISLSFSLVVRTKRLIDSYITLLLGPNPSIIKHTQGILNVRGDEEELTKENDQWDVRVVGKNADTITLQVSRAFS